MWMIASNARTQRLPIGFKRLYCLVINSKVLDIIVCTHAIDTILLDVVRTANVVTKDMSKVLRYSF